MEGGNRTNLGASVGKEKKRGKDLLVSPKDGKHKGKGGEEHPVPRGGRSACVLRSTQKDTEGRLS